LKTKIQALQAHLDRCLLCPRQCGAARNSGEIGLCGAGVVPKVASHCLHRGEEPPISGTEGSGTIFFAHCSMACVYCQNYPISQLGYGNPTDIETLTGMMLKLQRRGAHNINLVTATHYLPQIAEAVAGARRGGLTLPIVLNTSGYESAETIRSLEGIVQIYLVDMRYSSGRSSAAYSGRPDYPEVNRSAVREMVNQVGPLMCRRGIATEGVIIRHLLLPSLVSETRAILRFISGELPKNVPVSLMSQYFPANKAHDYPELNRRISDREYAQAVGFLEEFGLTTGWIQDRTGASLPVV
jgi:putative pyruvate formate lyase activating enzyme